MMVCREFGFDSLVSIGRPIDGPKDWGEGGKPEQ